MQSGAVAARLREQFGGDFVERVTPYTVGTTPVQIASNNPERAALLIISWSTAQITLAPRNNVTAGNGIVLSSQGSTVSIQMIDDYTLPTREWYAVSSLAGQTVEVIEMVLE